MALTIKLAYTPGSEYFPLLMGGKLDLYLEPLSQHSPRQLLPSRVLFA